MYPGTHAKPRAGQPAFIMAQSGEAVTYTELEARTNRLAHFLRSRALKRLDHYSIFMENNARYIECCGAGERSGLYYTCINSYLTANELAYIVNNSESRVLIFSEAMRAVALEALRLCPKIEVSLVVEGPATATAFSISTTRHQAFPPRPSPTSPSAPRCFIRRAPPAGPRASCGRCRNSRRRNNSHCSIFFKSCGAIVKNWLIYRPRRSIIRRRRPPSIWRSAMAAPPSSWKVSIRSAISSWSSNTSRPTASSCRRCSRAC